MRGILTTEIQNKANSFLKREISQKELRLYPYILFYKEWMSRMELFKNGWKRN